MLISVLRSSFYTLLTVCLSWHFICTSLNIQMNLHKFTNIFYTGVCWISLERLCLGNINSFIFVSLASIILFYFCHCTSFMILPTLGTAFEMPVTIIKSNKIFQCLWGKKVRLLLIKLIKPECNLHIWSFEHKNHDSDTRMFLLGFFPPFVMHF